MLPMLGRVSGGQAVCGNPVRYRQFGTVERGGFFPLHRGAAIDRLEASSIDLRDRGEQSTTLRKGKG